MEESLSSLKSSVNEQEFLKLTRTALRIIQNILNAPDKAKFRTVRAGSKVLQANYVYFVFQPLLFYAVPAAEATGSSVTGSNWLQTEG